MRSDMSPQEFVEGMLSHAWDSNVPRHLGRLECLSDDAAAEAATSEPALRAARMLMDLDAAVDAAVHAHPAGGGRCGRWCFGSVGGGRVEPHRRRGAVVERHRHGSHGRVDGIRRPARRSLTPSLTGGIDHFAAEKVSVLGCAGATRWMLQHGCTVAEISPRSSDLVR